MKTTGSLFPTAVILLNAFFCTMTFSYGQEAPDQLLEMYLETGSYEYSERIRDRFPGSPYDKFCHAWEYIDANNDMAHDLSMDLVGEYPDFAAGHFILGTILAIGSQDYPEALSHLERCLEIDPGFKQALYYRGLAKLGLKNYAGAKEDIDRVLELKRGFAQGFLLRGVANYGLGEEEAMNADFEIGLQLDYLALSAIPDNLAEKAINIAIESSPDNAIYFFARGYSHFSNGNYRSANADFGRCIQLVPGNSDFYKYSGASKMHVEDYEGAQKDLNYALSVNPDDPETYYYLGVLMNDYLKQPAMARQYMNHAIGLEENNALYYYERSKAAYKILEYEEARNDINRALLLDHRHGDFYALRGNIRMKTDKNAAEYCTDFKNAVEWGTSYNLKRILKKSCKQ
jgi:tetratricopeptide (TPR) repeat protein